MSKKLLFILFIFLFSAVTCVLKAQTVAAPALATPVAIDLEKHTVDELPFDKAFYFVGDIKKEWNIATIDFMVGNGRDAATKDLKNAGSFTATDRVHFVVPFLPDKFPNLLLPDREYTLKFICKDSHGNVLAPYSFTYGLVIRSKIGDHTKLDFGIAYAATPKALIGFTSVNIYFTPINDETNLKEITSLRRNIFLRTSVFMGISPITLSSDTKQPLKNKYGAGNFVFGIGIRSPFYGCYTKGIGRVGQKLLQPMRLSFGEMLYKQGNANPLITTDVNKAAFYVGLSYDINIAALLGPIGKLISP